MALRTVCRLCWIQFCNAKCALHDGQNPQVFIRRCTCCTTEGIRGKHFTKISPANSKENKISSKFTQSTRKYTILFNWLIKFTVIRLKWNVYYVVRYWFAFLHIIVIHWLLLDKALTNCHNEFLYILTGVCKPFILTMYSMWVSGFIKMREYLLQKQSALQHGEVMGRRFKLQLPYQ